RCTFACALLLAVGCDHRAPSNESDAATPTPGPSCMLPDATSCATDLGSALPIDVMASTSGAADEHSGASCAVSNGGSGVPDVTFQWTAPRAGRYDIATEASFDTLLSVHTGSCGG